MEKNIGIQRQISKQKDIQKNSDRIWEHPDNQNLSGRGPSSIAEISPAIPATTQQTTSKTPEAKYNPNMESPLNNLDNYSKNGDVSKIAEMDSAELGGAQIETKLHGLDAADARN